ncbi:ABC transporter permease subunit [Pseudoflavitalea sp. G-6-1-2]|uniref:ABC transporter permease subunit n=1 Tax=Pseudoflavitalea sp. G-6-1-2 TaxID=2728841 RepID=UPI00146B43A7|nr:Gldg family protein [Pseudoflavitalea sp. G-6-1-2]NML21674.1 ABC transporter permease subunit [Pseudoflavitalea sp. G-6-1-2]
MKLLFKIARNELRNLFYSPVAWLLSITFFVFCAVSYTDVFYPFAMQTALVRENDPDFVKKIVESMTYGIFNDPVNGYFVMILQWLYMFVPLLTMSIISRENNNGTIRLLYSSPITVRQIVLGKYLAMLFYNLIFILILGFFIGSAFFDLNKVDAGPMFSTLLGFYLLLNALSAIGFFMSSLTTYPIVAAIASFSFLLVLNYIGMLWQQYDFVRDLTYFLSINRRTEKMIAGLISSKDVVYYLVIVFMFLGFTILKLKAGRESKPWPVRASRYVLIVVVGLLIGYFTSRPGSIGYWDVSARKTNTLHPVTQKMMREMKDSTLDVTLFVNILGQDAQAGLPQYRNYYLDGMWEKYLRFNSNIQFRYVYYYEVPSGDSSLYRRFPGKSMKEIAGIMSETMHFDAAKLISAEQLPQAINLKDEKYKMVMQLRYKGRTTLLRTNLIGESGGTWPDEQVVNASLKRVTGAKMPEVYFVSGELERNIYKSGEREYSDHAIDKGNARSLLNLGFDCDTLNLQTHDIPASASIVVLADPKVELSATVQQKLKTYLAEGRNMLVFAEPGKQQLINPVLKPLGIQLMGGQLVQDHDNGETADKVNFNVTPASYDMADEWWLLYNRYLHSLKLKGFMGNPALRSIVGVASTKDSGFTALPLLKTTFPNTWLETSKLKVDSIAPVFNEAEGDIKKDSFDVGVLFTRPGKVREQRIMVFGDADIASNKNLISENVRSYYSYLDYNEYPIYINPPFAKDTYVTLSPGWAYGQKVVYVWGIPGLLLLAGTILLIRRKRK